MKPLQINVRDIFECPNHIGGTDLFMVQGIHHGAVGQCSVVDMIPIAEKLAPYHAGSTSARVPLRMLEAGCDAGVFTHTPANT